MSLFILGVCFGVGYLFGGFGGAVVGAILGGIVFSGKTTRHSDEGAFKQPDIRSKESAGIGRVLYHDAPAGGGKSSDKPGSVAIKEKNPNKGSSRESRRDAHKTYHSTFSAVGEEQAAVRTVSYKEYVNHITQGVPLPDARLDDALKNEYEVQLADEIIAEMQEEVDRELGVARPPTQSFEDYVQSKLKKPKNKKRYSNLEKSTTYGISFDYHSAKKDEVSSDTREV